MRLIDADALLKDTEDLKKSPWYLAGYISDQRRLGMKEGLDMASSCSKHATTIEAIPVEFIEAEIKRMEDEITHALIEYKHADGTIERMIARRASLEFTLAKWRAENGNAGKR